MERTWLNSAERVRAMVLGARMPPASFRAELEGVPANERDAWLDRVLRLDAIPNDGPALPRGCVPYLPCSVAALLRLMDQAHVGASDTFVDVGSGVGRAGALVQLCTGAAVIGVEIQPELVRASRGLAARLSLPDFSILEGDAAELAGHITGGTVFFSYCPFSGARVERMLDGLESIAQMKRIRVCSVDLPLPSRAWLRLVPGSWQGLVVYESTLVNDGVFS